MQAGKKAADKTIRNFEGPTKTNPEEQQLFPKLVQLIRASVLHCTSLNKVKLFPAFLTFCQSSADPAPALLSICLEYEAQC